jgi:hypothetical protein
MTRWRFSILAGLVVALSGAAWMAWPGPDADAVAGSTVVTDDESAQTEMLQEIGYLK